MNAANLFLGFAINLAVAILIVRFIYYPAQQSKNFVFTFLGFSTVIYLIASFLTATELGVGTGFGLFAIFSVLRYRTSPMPAREMTYLFAIIALSVLSALLMQSGTWLLLTGISALLCAVLFVLEREWGFQYEGVKVIKYERVDLTGAEQYADLLADLRQRTGLALTRVEVGTINYVNELANVKVYYSQRSVQGRHFIEEAALAGDED